MTDTKSHKRRRVDMTMHLTETLRAHRTAQKRDALNRSTEKAGLRRVRTHSLRHSYATIRLMKGHNVGDVNYQLGHSSIKITYDVYAHWMPGQFKSEVDELDALHPVHPIRTRKRHHNNIHKDFNSFS